jgi:hypothetical protein
MSVVIEIEAPLLLPQLVALLEAADCWAVPISSRACRVVHLYAEDANEAMTELRFFAKAWARNHGGVGMHLRPGV